MARRTGTYYINQARKNGLIVKGGKSDHVKIYAKNGEAMAVVPINLKGNGTEHSIIKWFLKLGIIVIFITLILSWLG